MKAEHVLTYWDEWILLSFSHELGFIFIVGRHRDYIRKEMYLNISMLFP